MSPVTARAVVSLAEALPAEGDEALEAIARDIEATQAQAVLRIAERLHHAREIFRHRRDEGGFTGWVARRLTISQQTAYNLISIHERFGGESFQNLETLSRSVLYAIAAPGTPAEVRDAVTARAAAGEHVSLADVAALKERWAAERSDLQRQVEGARARARDARASTVDYGQQLADLQRDLAALRDERDSLKYELAHRPVAAAAAPRSSDLATVEAQVSHLLGEWQRATPAAQSEFLKRINTTPA